jgi:hypothetical protein
MNPLKRNKQYKYNSIIQVVEVNSNTSGPSWPWSYGSWIYNYLCNQCLSPLMLWVRISIRVRCTTLCDKVCQWLAKGLWISPVVNLCYCLFVWWCLKPLSPIFQLYDIVKIFFMEKTEGPGENHRPFASHWQTLSHNVVHLTLIEIRTHNISGDRHWLLIGSCKSNYDIRSPPRTGPSILLDFRQVGGFLWLPPPTI